MTKTQHINGSKKCSSWQTLKVLSEYSSNRSRWDGLRPTCRSCDATQYVAVYARRKAQILAYGRIYRSTRKDARESTRLKSKFGISLATYVEILQQQGGVCKICGGIDKKKLHVDHCHETKRIRGLLCSRCNMALGLFRESPLVIASAMEYLRSAA